MRTVSGTVSHVSPVHSACSTSAGPTPRAAQLNAPPAQVCESAQTSSSPGRARPCSATIWWQMPDVATSCTSSTPNALAKRRPSRWASASAIDGAGTAWSKITDTRSGSVIRSGMRQPLNPRNCMSISTTRCTRTVTTSPGDTRATPQAAATTFSIVVAPGPVIPPT